MSNEEKGYRSYGVAYPKGDASDADLLRWIHDRIHFVYGESGTEGWMHRFREVIDRVDQRERAMPNPNYTYAISPEVDTGIDPAKEGSEEEYVLGWGSEPGEFRRIRRAEYEAQYGPIISVDFHPSQLRELDPIIQAQHRVGRTFAIMDQIIATLTEEHMSARTAADPKSTNAPEVEAAAADIATFYRYLTTHGVDKETAKELTCRYQADQFNQAYVARAEAAKATVMVPVAEGLTKKA